VSVVDSALRALNRFGLGARIGERAGLSDPRGWLEEQLRPENALLSGGRLPTHADAADATRRVQEAQRSKDQDEVRGARRALRGILTEEERASLGQRVTTDAPFVERLVAFWSNHLCVSVAAKQPVVPLAGLYEREAIRPHVLGSFADMVLASARHPAMLFYLDNFQSIGPDSPAARLGARRRARGGGRGQGAPRGLNENYARELMELHTVGVDGGYTQDDVIALARILTGWSVTGVGPRERGMPRTYEFRAAAHEPGAKTVMGRRYDEGGEREGEDAIRDLCAHPSTARFVATKLVRHFVADDPPAAAVDRIGGVFRDTHGDLAQVSRALVRLDEAWEPESRKLRTPQDWTVAMLRALHAQEAPPVFVGVLVQLRHPLWAPTAPKGYGDAVADWADPDSLMHRAELARSVASQGRAVQLEPTRFLDAVDVADGDPLPAMLADASVSKDERLAIAMGGPAFQWR
jgi:uncharacterized protein (DUF1800 family)